MERRFAVRRQELREECRVEAKTFAGIEERLEAFSQPFVASLVRSEQRGHGRTYLRGLLSNLKRKNVESIAYLHEQDRRSLQNFIGLSPWDHRPLVAELVWQVSAVLGEPDGVLIFDPSGFRKSGDASVGVQRQWLGRYGKVDNGQVGVYLGYASRREHALVDQRLYLPKEWAKDRKRCRKCGVPKEERRFRTRHELCLEMLDEHGATLPHAWVTGDDEMGRSSAFRGELRARNEPYLLAVPSNTLVRDQEQALPEWCGWGPKPGRPWQRVDAWVKTLPRQAWTRVDVRDGHRGPLKVEVVTRRVTAHDDERHEGPAELLVVVRAREGGAWKYDYYLSNAAADTPREEFARVAKAEHRIEECFQRAKSEAGLADFEVRTWIGWQHHQTLSLLATWFLTCEARDRKKNDARADGPPSAGLSGSDPAADSLAGDTAAPSPRMHASVATHGRRTVLFLETTQPVGALAD